MTRAILARDYLANLIRELESFGYTRAEAESLIRQAAEENANA